MNFIFTDDILCCATAMSGISVSEGVLRRLCQAASENLVARLKAGISPKEIKELFVTAAGMIALSMYIASSGTGELSSFKAGSVSATLGGGVGADALYEQGERLLSAYLVDQGFEFMAVKG